MAVWTPFRGWLEFGYDLLYQSDTSGVNPPADNLFYALLIDATLNDAQTFGTIVGNEVSGNGYARQNITFPSQRVWDGTDNRLESDFVNFTFDAVGGAIEYQSVIIIANGAAAQGNTDGTAMFYSNYGAQTIDAGSGQEFKMYVATY